MLATLRQHALAWVVAAAALWGLYVLFVYPSLPGVELAVGAGSAALAATALVAIRAQGLLDYSLRFGGPGAVWRIPLRTALDFWTLTRVHVRGLAGRPARGSFRTVAHVGGGAEPEAQARRAWLTVLGTIAPNTIVVTIDRERDLMLLHELVPDPSGGGPL